MYKQQKEDEKNVWSKKSNSFKYINKYVADLSKQKFNQQLLSNEYGSHLRRLNNSNELHFVIKVLIAISKQSIISDDEMIILIASIQKTSKIKQQVIKKVYLDAKSETLFWLTALIYINDKNQLNPVSNIAKMFLINLEKEEATIAGSQLIDQHFKPSKLTVNSYNCLGYGQIEQQYRSLIVFKNRLSRCLIDPCISRLDKYALNYDSFNQTNDNCYQLEWKLANNWRVMVNGDFNRATCNDLLKQTIKSNQCVSGKLANCWNQKYGQVGGENIAIKFPNYEKPFNFSGMNKIVDADNYCNKAINERKKMDKFCYHLIFARQIAQNLLDCDLDTLIEARLLYNSVNSPIHWTFGYLLSAIDKKESNLKLSPKKIKPIKDGFYIILSAFLLTILLIVVLLISLIMHKRCSNQ